jgi:two-component system chemotaxis sensor kinase CheA
MSSLSDEFCTQGLALANPSTLQIEQSNQAFVTMLGISKPMANGLELKDIVPRFDQAAMQRAFEKSVPEYVLEGEVRPLKGRAVPLRISMCKHGDADCAKILIRVTDISELYKYSFLIKSIEELLEANKKRAEEAQKNFRAILDALPQQFITVDNRGAIGADHSAEASTIFSQPIAGEDFWKLSGLDEGYREVVDLAFAGVAWDTVAQLFPHQFTLHGRLIEVKFVPMYSEGAVSALVVPCQDVTEMRSLMEVVERQNRQAKVVYAVLSARAEFLELLELAESLDMHVEKPEEMMVRVHTLKGGFLLFGCHELSNFCHAAETEWAEHCYESSSGLLFVQNLRQRIDAFLAEYRDFLGIARREDLRRKDLLVDLRAIELLHQEIKSLPLADSLKSPLIAQLESAVSVPLWKTLGWLEKIWQETLRDVGKAGARITWNASVATTRDPYKHLFQSLLHVVRNAAVHGIEPVEERLRQGKPREGNLTISCAQVGNRYTISIADDGRGVDFGAIRRTAINRGLSAAKHMREEELIELMLSPAFSIETKADQLSGRGIGLAVVRQEARALGGDVVVTTKPGQGTTFTVSFEHQEPFCSN